MSKREKTGNVWYAISNIASALLFGSVAMIVGPLATRLGSLLFLILGIATIIQGIASLGTTGIGGTVASIILGVLMIVFSDRLMESDLFNRIAFMLMGAFIAFVGFVQIAKISDRYGNDTKFKVPLKILSIFIPLLLLGCGALLIVHAVLDFFHPIPVLSSIAGDLGTIGAIIWILYTVLVLVAVSQSGLTINDFKNNKSSSSSSRRTSSSSGRSSRPASEQDVRSAMRAIASYYTGGWDYVGSKRAEIKYSVSSSVGNGKINFQISYKVNGMVEQSEVDYVRNQMGSLLEKKKKTILNEACEKVKSLGPDRDYSIEVGVS